VEKKGKKDSGEKKEEKTFRWFKQKLKSRPDKRRDRASKKVATKKKTKVRQRESLKRVAGGGTPSKSGRL